MIILKTAMAEAESLDRSRAPILFGTRAHPDVLLVVLGCVTIGSNLCCFRLDTIQSCPWVCLISAHSCAESPPTDPSADIYASASPGLSLSKSGPHCSCQYCLKTEQNIDSRPPPDHWIRILPLRRSPRISHACLIKIQLCGIL